MFRPAALLATAAVSLMVACGSESATPTSTGTTTTTPLPAGYDKFTNGVSVRVDGSFVVVSTTDVPNHVSPYFGVGKAGYEAPTAGMMVNPNLISAQSYVFRIPAKPVAAASGADTPMDAIGVSLNGVVFFNQYAAGRTALGPEIVSFDRFNGHPAQRNNYHYHLEPYFLTGASKSALIGFMLDGFPIYGPNEISGGAAAALDSCNGHSHATTEYTAGIYHYHVVPVPPYLVGCFKGTPGTVTN